MVRLRANARGRCHGWKVKESMFKDILFYASSYPQRTSEVLIREAIAAAAAMGARITVLVGDPDPVQPIGFYRGMEAIEAVRVSINNVARQSLRQFEEEARRRKVPHEGEIVNYTGEDVFTSLLERARVRDLTILPFSGEDRSWPLLAERLIFESGRPVLLYPTEPRRPFSLQSILVAWDFSRSRGPSTW